MGQESKIHSIIGGIVAHSFGGNNGHIGRASGWNCGQNDAWLHLNCLQEDRLTQSMGAVHSRGGDSQVGCS